MKSLLVFMIAAGMLFTACKDKKNPEKTTEQKENTVADPVKDSAEIRTVITEFYNWYDKNFAKFQDYDLYSSTKKKNSPPYKINWDVVEKYQQFIKDSVPQLGAEFLSNQKRFFQQCDSAFKVDVEDDIPYGFDYDWYTNSQEDVQYTVDQVNGDNSWPMQIEGDHATVRINGSREERDTGLVIIMKKENGKWTIANIGGNY